jgi:hypothetical protein
METLSVRCNHCGAPLQVSDATRFVTCQFCQSSLEVKRTESSIFTEEVAKIAENTGKMAEGLEVIALQNEIEKLDREWGIEQMNSMVPSRSGPRPPGNPWIGLAFTIFFAAGCFSMASLASSERTPDIPGIFIFVPVGMGLFALFAGISGVFKGETRKVAQASYQQRRTELEHQLETLRSK